MTIMSESETGSYEYPCPHCGAGRKRLRHITYLTWFRDQMITVPNFPAWVCDLCGGRDFDSRAISWLNTILNTQEQHPSGQSERRTGTPPGVV